MKFFRRSFPILFAGLLALSIEAGAREDPAAPALRLPGRCGLCHVDRVEPSRDGTFNFLTLRRETFSGGPGVCYSCHNGPVRDSRRSIWSGLQHASDGSSLKMKPGERASCGTCHTPHETEEGISTFMRFGKGTFTHCLRCHPGRSGDRAGEHPSASVGREGGLLKSPNCGACHRMHRAPGKGLMVRAEEGALCSRCHGENPSREGKGGGMASHPVGGENPSCEVCHLVHRAVGEGLVKREMWENALCRRCHEDRAGVLRGDGNHLLLPGEVECLSCHRMHNAPSQEKKTDLLLSAISGTWDPCRSCHAQLTTDRDRWSHPVGMPAVGASAERLQNLARFGGLLDAEEKVVCLTCHRAHGALEGSAMLVARREAICLYCHNTQNSLAWKSARPGNHPVSVRATETALPETLRGTAAGDGARGLLTCLNCHRAHNGAPETPGLLLPQEEYACTLCHRDPPGFADSAHRKVDKAAPCRSCHGYHGWNVDFDSVSLGGNTTEKLCWSCHGPEGSAPMGSYFGHVVGVPAPGPADRIGLPLFQKDGKAIADGLIGCPTCHDAHRGGGHMLRLRDDGKTSDLCLACHRQQETVAGTRHDLSLLLPEVQNRAGEGASQTGPCGACHLVHTESPGDPWARPLPEEALTGPTTALCITCHREGSPASNSVVSEVGHPAADLLEVNPEMTIVGCEGCHDPHRWNPADPEDRGDSAGAGDGANSFLVSPLDGSSALCRRCHSSQFAVTGTKHDLAEEGEGICGNCHLSHGGEPLLLWPSPLSGQGTFGSETCFTCHWERSLSPQDPGDERTQHPIHVFSKRKPLAELPLYAPAGRRHPRGRISCGTCHDPHRWSRYEKRADEPSAPANAATSFLRIPADRTSLLCQACHPEESVVLGTDHDLRVTAPDSVNSAGETATESGVCGACHSAHDAPQGTALWNRKPGAGEDLQSRACRSCHEVAGTGGGSVPQRLETHFVAYPGKGMVSRPFTRRTSFISEEFPRLRLYDRDGEKKNRGFISCASCHDPHRWEPGARLPGAGTPLDGDLSNSFLKVQDNFAITRFFCKECHAEETLDLYRGYHSPGAPSGEDGQE